ncbi:hypothetical protein MLD38_024889 [Melastoma candidum]|uniref:Uncharacterized protein n=1 Tax=Melastoma candidum TaxID=119954 RepID=A0ACB9NWQ6_9MYRT|nr:hypothetical protein MLD38_024889 [Melastoma candidum]
MGSKQRTDPRDDDGASPGKIFIGGLARDVSFDQFNDHFGSYGEMVDSVIMKDRLTGQPRGFGFVTYADPSVVDKVIEETHVLNGKQVEIKRTIPKGSGQSNDFKTKKIFVGGIPSSVTEDELKDFFSKYGKVVEHEIIRDRMTNRSRGFGFVIFDSEEVVDEILFEGNMIDLAGSKVEIKKAEPKKPSNPPPSGYGRNSRASSFNDGFGGGYGGSYGGFDGGYGPSPYRTPGGLGSRYGGGYGYGAGGGGGDFGRGYGGYGGSGLGGYHGESSFGYSGRYGPYGGGFGGGYGTNSFGGYGREGDGYGYGGYGGSGYGGGYDSGPGSTYGGGGGMYGRGGYSGSSRYHPYAR